MSVDVGEVAAVPSTYERLAAPFALSEHAKVNKGGMDQTYAPWTEYVERMNGVLGVGMWSVRIVREGFTDTECWVLAEVDAIIDGQRVVRQQYGCEPIAKGRDAKPTTDLLKSTASDAIKKAVSLLGPGLYLSVKEERVAIEAAMREAVKEAAAAQRAANAPKAQAGSAATSVAAGTSPASRSASTRSASSAAPSSSSTTATAAVLTGADPTVLKTKAELAADLRKGVEYARSLGLDVEDVDPAPMNRADIEDTIGALRQMCRDVLAERRKQQAAT